MQYDDITIQTKNNRINVSSDPMPNMFHTNQEYVFESDTNI